MPATCSLDRESRCRKRVVQFSFRDVCTLPSYKSFSPKQKELEFLLVACSILPYIRLMRWPFLYSLFLLFFMIPFYILPSLRLSFSVIHGSLLHCSFSSSNLLNVPPRILSSWFHYSILPSMLRYYKLIYPSIHFFFMLLLPCLSTSFLMHKM